MYWPGSAGSQDLTGSWLLSCLVSSGHIIVAEHVRATALWVLYLDKCAGGDCAVSRLQISNEKEADCAMEMKINNFQAETESNHTRMQIIILAVKISGSWKLIFPLSWSSCPSWVKLNIQSQDLESCWKGDTNTREKKQKVWNFRVTILTVLLIIFFCFT